MAGIWRATSPNQNPPVQYVVYSTTTTEASHQDDVTTSYRTYVYLNLWSDIDPTEMAGRIRAAMYAYGFAMVEESDKGYNQPAYDTATLAVHRAVDVVLARGGGAACPLKRRALTI